MTSDPWISAYDATRDPGRAPLRAVCYAPFGSLYLDPRGNVRACCQNVLHTLGNVTENRLRDIWRGPRTARLRAALVAYDLSQGCEFCHWQLAKENFRRSLARSFDDLPLADSAAEWPVQLELALSNVCNLACVMCNGEWSSTIRARRDRLPPLSRVYDEAFFTDLAEFIPHLRRLKFLGGEPFLQTEAFRVWDLLIAGSSSASVHVTTNATQWNEQVERVAESLAMSFIVSLDGSTAKTYEAVRQGARFSEVIANADRLRAITRRKRTHFSIAFCLLRRNWREFLGVLHLADQWDCDVELNTVVQPADESVYHLAPPDLAEIVAELERLASQARLVLSRNLPVWEFELARLRQQLEQPAELACVVGERLTLALPQAATGSPQPGHALAVQAARDRLAAWSDDGRVDVLECDLDDQVERLRSDGAGLLGLFLEPRTGRSHLEVFEQLRQALGFDTREVSRERHSDSIERLTEFVRSGNIRSQLRSITLPRYDSAGRATGTLTLLALRRAELRPGLS